MNAFNEIYQDLYKKCGMEFNEKKKKDTFDRIAFIVIIIIMILICIKTKNYYMITITGIFTFLGPIYMVFNYMDYKVLYKEKIIKTFVEGYSKDLNYYPQGGISPVVYNKAKFDGRYDKYHSEDLIEGKIMDECKVSMSEVHTQKREQTTDSDGHTHTSYTTLFHGLFAFIEMNSLNSVEFMIKSNAFLSDKFGGKNKLNMDSGEFEKIFDVTTLDKISTLRILTADVMQMLIDFKNKNKVTPEIVLNSKGLFIRFELGNVFEPKLIKSDIDYDSLKKTYDIITFTLDLAKVFSKNILEFEA